MPDKTIPRWEWRTFSKDLSEYRYIFDKYEPSSEFSSREIYLLGREQKVNCKIRNKLLDIKLPLQIDLELNLELWTLFSKENFPLAVNKIADLLQMLGQESMSFEREKYSIDEFLNEIVVKHPTLFLVDVIKNRKIYKIDGTRMEFSQAAYCGNKFHTMAIEDHDPEIVASYLKKFNLYHLENINYIKALQRIFFPLWHPPVFF